MRRSLIILLAVLSVSVMVWGGSGVPSSPESQEVSQQLSIPAEVWENQDRLAEASSKLRSAGFGSACMILAGVYVDASTATIHIGLTKIADLVSSMTGDFLAGMEIMKRAMPGASGDTIKEPTRMGAFSMMPAAKATEGPSQRPSVVNDFKGSKFTITQTFRDQDPDRVARQMIRGLEQAAEKRTQSAFVPAFAT